MPWRRWILKSLLRITETITGSISAPLSFSFLRTYLHRGGERWGNLLWWGNPPAHIISHMVIPPIMKQLSFWLEHFQTQSSGFENERQDRKRQFLLLKVKTLPACAGDLFYSSWSPVGWSGRGCHVKWLNDSRTECSCNHLTHFAVLMQFDTDSELKTGQSSILQKVGHRTERTEVSL